VLRVLGLVLVASMAAVVGFAGTAQADGPFGGQGPGRVVFVQTDNPAGNQIVAYDRASNGTLTAAQTYNTGGLGGVLGGSMVDHLASQGSLTFDAGHGLLFAVNAGSNTVSVFAVHGDQLSLRQIVGSGGTFPVSIAVYGNVVYVLNARNGGAIQGFVVALDHLIPVPIWNRPLGLNPSASPEYTNTPGQVAFTPDGRHLIVTTKANTNAIDVFGIGLFGPSASPVVTTLPSAVPFAVDFDQVGHLLVTEAGPSTVASFAVRFDGTLTPIDSAATGQPATCWITSTRFGTLHYASNAGGPSLSTLHSDGFGHLALAGTTGTDAGTVDASVSRDGAYLYVQTGGAGNVDEFKIQPDATLTPIGSVTVPGAQGGEGIVAF
jgi:6-phosphogluconolactonase (cycloisomerase 2 family)